MEKIEAEIIQPIDCINRAAVEQFMSKKFAAYNESTKTVLAAFERVLSDEPDRAIDSARVALSGTSPLLPLTMKMIPLFKAGLACKGEPIGLGVKIEILSCLWDCSDALAFPAQILSQSKAKLRQRKEIWSHFGCFGLTARDQDRIRSIRNCCAHGIRIRDGYLLKTTKHGEIDFDRNGDEIKVCPLSDVDQIFEKADLIFSWWMTLIGSIAVFSPRFVIILIRALFEQSSDKSNNLGNVLEELFPSENWVKTPKRSNSPRMPAKEDTSYYMQKLLEIISRLVVELKKLSTDAQDEFRADAFTKWAEGLSGFLQKLISWQNSLDFPASLRN
jgi:hypothetical protein